MAAIEYLQRLRPDPYQTSVGGGASTLPTTSGINKQLEVFASALFIRATLVHLTKVWRTG